MLRFFAVALMMCRVAAIDEPVCNVDGCPGTPEEVVLMQRGVHLHEDPTDAEPTPEAPFCLRNSDTIFTFDVDTVAANNLGGKGPERDQPEVIRWGKVAKYVDPGTNEEIELDLVLQNASEYFVTQKPRKGRKSKTNRKNGVYKKAGVSTGLAQVNVVTGKKVDFDFIICRHGTDTEVVLPSFPFSFFDMDIAHEDYGKEEITVYGATEYATYSDTDNPTMLKFEPVKDENGVVVGRRYYATAAGDKSNNPLDPTDLTLHQKTLAVSFRFESVSRFRIQMKAAKVNERNPFGGRNFMFSGKSGILGPC